MSSAAVLLLLVVCCHGLGVGNTPQGNEIKTKPTGKKRFLVESAELNWFENRVYCKARGMQPVSIENEQESDDIVAAIMKAQPTKSVWLEGTDMGKRGNWYWMTTLEWIKYTNWHKGHPGPGRHCLHYYYGNNEYKWGAYECSNISNVACEYY